MYYVLSVLILMVLQKSASEVNNNSTQDIDGKNETAPIETTAEAFTSFREIAEKYAALPFNMSMTLFTRGGYGELQALEMMENGTKAEFRSLSSSKLNPKTQTIFIIHGLLDGPKITSWQMRMKNAILKRRNYNVIVVDWSAGAQFPLGQAVVNARTTAQEISKAVKILMRTKDMPASSVHLIGHGMGSHVAGMVGKLIPDIGRITGLDPMGTLYREFPAEDRLSPSDANFVDIIHTNSAENDEHGMGAPAGMGHIEYFANDGNRQPGCIAEKKAGVVNFPFMVGMFKPFACDHFRAPELFINFMTYADSCVPVAYACSDYLSFLKGECMECNKKRDCAIVGMRATKLETTVAEKSSDQSPRKFFFKTASRPPFCMIQHHVQIALSKQQFGKIPGELLITVTGPLGSASASVESGYTGFTPGSSVVTLLSSKKRIGKVVGLGIMWRPLFSSLPLKVDYVRVLAMNFIETKIRQRRTGFFCVPGPDRLVSPHVPVTLYPAEQCSDEREEASDISVVHEEEIIIPDS